MVITSMRVQRHWLCLILGGLCGVSSAPGNLFDYTEITATRTGRYSGAGMNDNGDVVGTVLTAVDVYGNQQSVLKPFVYTDHLALLKTDSTIPNATGAGYSINNQGMIAGYTDSGTWKDHRCAYWSSASAAPTLIPTPEQASISGCNAVKISDVVSSSFTLAVDSNVDRTQSFFHTPGTGTTVVTYDNGKYAASLNTTRLADLANNGNFVGSADTDRTIGQSDAIIGNYSGSSLTFAPYRAYTGGTTSLWGINTNGDAVGNASWGAKDGFGNGLWKAILRKADGTLVDLGTGSGTRASAFKINDFGVIVGQSVDSNFNGTGCLFKSGTGAVDLNTLVDLPSGVKIVSALEVNKTGQILAQVQKGSDVNNVFLWRLNPNSTTTSLNTSIGHFDSLAGWNVYMGSDFAHAQVVPDPVSGLGSVLQLTTGSPISVGTTINTPASPYFVGFQYYLDQPTGEISVTIDGVAVGSVDGSAAPTGTWLSATFPVSDPLLQGQLMADFRLTYNDTSSGQVAYVDNVTVSVPEPTVIGSLAGLGILLAHRRAGTPRGAGGEPTNCA